MNRLFFAGALVALAGAAGYVVGVDRPYPGRALSLTAVMLGITLLAMGRTGETEDAV
jgi:hypothetical protein